MTQRERATAGENLRDSRRRVILTCRHKRRCAIRSCSRRVVLLDEVPPENVENAGVMHSWIQHALARVSTFLIIQTLPFPGLLWTQGRSGGERAQRLRKADMFVLVKVIMIFKRLCGD